MQTGLLDRRKWRTRLEPADAAFERLEIFPTGSADTRWSFGCTLVGFDRAPRTRG